MDSVGINKSFGSSSYDEPDDGDLTSTRDRFGKLWAFLVQEARAVSLWSLLSVFLRFTLVCLGMFVELRNDSSSREGLFGASKELLVTASVVVGWVLSLAPSKVLLLQAPGFIFANPWLLLWVSDKTGVIPNIPIRACEYVMGRISLPELAALIPVHVVAMVSTSVFLRRILPDSIVLVALDPIKYSDGDNPWIVDLSREILASAGFSVAMLVLPVLFQLNYMPRWSFVFMTYPLFNFSVDGPGVASTFSPNVLLTLSLLGHRPLPAVWRLIGPLLGGLVGGRVMKIYFPDRSRRRSPS